MKKLLLILAVMCLIVPVASAASLSTLDNTSHSKVFGCGVCHDAHNSGVESVGAAPLWGSIAGTENLTGYTIEGSRGYQGARTLGSPSGQSLMCLGCHDGTSHTTSTSARTAGADDIASASADGYVNTQFMHPISIDYTTIANSTNDTSDFFTDAPTGVTLYSGSLECGTCHDIHDASPADGATGSALRLSSSQALCDACHIE